MQIAQHLLPSLMEVILQNLRKVSVPKLVNNFAQSFATDPWVRKHIHPQLGSNGVQVSFLLLLKSEILIKAGVGDRKINEFVIDSISE